MKLLLLLTWIWLTGPGDQTAREANHAYEQGDFARAIQLYRDALREEPESPRLWYNLGTALAQADQGEEAIDAFDQAHQLFETPEDRARARYNAGHLMSQLEQYEEAVRLFRESLIEEPDDADARHNYELAKRRLEESQNENSDSSDSDDNDQDPESDQEPDPQSGNPPPGPENQQSRGQQPPPSQMSPEEAQSLLDALQQQERELLENRNRSEQRPESDDANW